jgi:hypothetical protein
VKRFNVKHFPVCQTIWRLKKKLINYWKDEEKIKTKMVQDSKAEFFRSTPTDASSVKPVEVLVDHASFQTKDKPEDYFRSHVEPTKQAPVLLIRKEDVDKRPIDPLFHRPHASGRVTYKQSKEAAEAHEANITGSLDAYFGLADGHPILEQEAVMDKDAEHKRTHTSVMMPKSTMYVLARTAFFVTTSASSTIR